MFPSITSFFSLTIIIMDLKDYIRWGNVPEFVLNNLWHLEINDGPENKPRYKDYFTEQMLDYGITEINFSQESLKFEKTSFGLTRLLSMEEYNPISITFYDYVESPIDGKPFPIHRFFQDWMDYLYDREKRCVRNNWRKHSKSIQATLTRYFNKGVASSFARGIANQGISYANTFINPLGFKITDNRIGKTNFGVEEKEIVTYDIQNCYITSLKEISLDDSDGDRKTFNAELICERVNPIFKENQNKKE